MRFQYESRDRNGIAANVAPNCGEASINDAGRRELMSLPRCAFTSMARAALVAFGSSSKTHRRSQVKADRSADGRAAAEPGAHERRGRVPAVASLVNRGVAVAASALLPDSSDTCRCQHRGCLGRRRQIRSCRRRRRRSAGMGGQTSIRLAPRNADNFGSARRPRPGRRALFEAIPRISRAQVMDAPSSQNSRAYRGALLAALDPVLSDADDGGRTVKPATVLVSRRVMYLQ